MTHRHGFRFTTRVLPLGALLVVLGVTVAGPEQPSTTSFPVGTRLERGRVVYLRYCVGCHGEKGDGRGPATPRLLVMPRDFTAGTFKFRSTRSGQLPFDEDLLCTITRGVHRTSMPGFPLMPERDRMAVIEYVKTFSDRWRDPTEQRDRVRVPEPPANLYAPETARRGRLIYAVLGCFSCHGKFGQGDGPSSVGMKDNWGHPIKPFDFTRGTLKSGDRPSEIYRTFHTGLNGTPMPDYSDTLARVDRDWIAENAVFQGAFSQAELDGYDDAIGQLPHKDALRESLTDPPEVQRLTEQRSWELVAYILSLRKSGGPARGVRK